MKDTIITDKIIVLKDTLAQITHAINLTESTGDNSQLISNSITILIALIAALIALYQVKSNIISSSRITWIENLRTAISEYVAEVNDCAIIICNVHFKCLQRDQGEIDEIIEEYYPLYIIASRKIDKLGSKVLLYLNSDETNHKKIEDIITGIDKQLHKDKMSDLDEKKIEDDIKEILKSAKLIFKTEWAKSKKIFKI
ncbi:hypothetical protein SAMN05661096_02010 [Marivirga sericea]|uniref:Uncharacterized protein n=1 Tax=Marivirga sericea TaxID=1028 RepID=A0A1X7JT61_9BACT|nr:hypothetical protein [Marivirga sericea]SMG30827.1 hypothetical protein SAMN05661096_02010 [Marivirga sericea]